MLYTYTDQMAHVNDLTQFLAAWIDALCTACEGAGNDIALERIRFAVGAHLVGWRDEATCWREINRIGREAGFVAYGDNDAPNGVSVRIYHV